MTVLAHEMVQSSLEHFHKYRGELVGQLGKLRPIGNRPGLGRRPNSGVTNPVQDAIRPHLPLYEFCENALAMTRGGLTPRCPFAPINYCNFITSRANRRS
jgi:hypothetical protein